VHAGVLPPDTQPQEAFFVAADFLSQPGIFGLIMAALTAALMSTVDTLITAVSAVAVNDVYRPYVRPQASERELLKVARVCAVAVTLLGIALVPLFMMFESIYAAHGAMTAAVTPPLVVALLLSVFWRRFTRKAALLTLVGGMAAIAVSLFVPQVIAPLAHGVPLADAGEGLFAGMRQYKFMRALYGLVVSGAIAVIVTLLTKPDTSGRARGLVWGTIADAIERYKGSPGHERSGRRAIARPRPAGDDRTHESTGLPLVNISRGLARMLDAAAGDLLYVSDRRAWLGGLHSTHAIVGDVIEEPDETLIELGATSWNTVVTPHRLEEPIAVERLY
jgi:hypothetical protein